MSKIRQLSTVWIKFGVRDIHTMVLKIYDFLEDRNRKRPCLENDRVTACFDRVRRFATRGQLIGQRAVMLWVVLVGF